MSFSLRFSLSQRMEEVEIRKKRLKEVTDDLLDLYLGGAERERVLELLNKVGNLEKDLEEISQELESFISELE